MFRQQATGAQAVSFSEAPLRSAKRAYMDVRPGLARSRIAERNVFTPVLTKTLPIQSHSPRRRNLTEPDVLVMLA
jgi:hypothetical protein